MGKLKLIIGSFFIIAIGILVVLTIPDGGKSAEPTGYKATDGLTVKELKQKADFEFSALSDLPFSVSDKEGIYHVTKYGSKTLPQVTIHYKDDDTGQEIYYIVSEQKKDIQEVKSMSGKTINIGDGIKAKYDVEGVGEGIQWVENGKMYGIYNHIEDGQPLLKAKKMKELAEQVL